MAEENKFSMDMNAEQLLLGNMLNQESDDSENNIKFVQAEELPRAEKYQFAPSDELPESEPFNYQTENTEVPKTTSLYVESKVTGINYSIDSSFDSLSNKVSEIEDTLGNVSKDVLEAYKTINHINSGPKPSDNFEERVTILPTNLIYDDRVQRSIDAPSWV